MYLIEAKATGRHPYFGHLSSKHLLAVCTVAAASERRGIYIVFLQIFSRKNVNSSSLSIYMFVVSCFISYYCILKL
jgi:hypothetical protein